MGLPKGKTNNYLGRPKGSLNSVNRDLREMIGEILAGNFAEIDKFMNELEPRDKMKFILELLPYCLPKIEAVTFDKVKPQEEKTLSLIDQMNDYLSKGYNEKHANDSL